MTSLDDDGENGDIGRIDTRNPCCLGQGLGSVLLELFATFKAHGCAGVVVEPGGDADGLILFGPCGCDLLLTDVTGVMMPDPELFDYWPCFVGRERKEVQMLPSERVDLLK